jgi:hypothetical protein
MSTYTGNGQYTVSRMSIVYDDGIGNGNNKKEIDLVLAYYQVDLYESIFDYTMSGSIAILDTFNLQDLLPLYGNESIELEFYTQGNQDNPILYSGVVYKVSEKHRITEHASGYSIYFISRLSIESQKKNIQRGFQDTPSSIVESIFKSALGDSEKLLDMVPTMSIDTYTFGTVKPLEAFSMLSKHSYSKQSECGYVFYEDNLQFNFKPLQFLYKQDPVTEYRSRNRGMHDKVDQRVQESHNTIQDLRLMEENSYLDRMVEGQHGAKFMRFDLNSKSVETFNYDKSSEYDNNKSLGAIAFKKELDVSYDNKTTIRYGNSPKTLLDKMAIGISSHIELDTIRAELIVFGDSTLRAGNCLIANLPIWNKDQDKVTDMLSGKFLITSIHHQLHHDEKYLQTMMIQKEAYEEL